MSQQSTKLAPRTGTIRAGESQEETIPKRIGEGFSSKQEGVLLPTERKYKPKTHKVVSAEEAQINMMKRSNGEMKPIEGGLDDMMAFEDQLPNEGVDKISVVAVDLPDDMEFDPLGDIKDLQPGDPELEAEERALAAESSRTVTEPPLEIKTATNVPVREEINYVRIAEGPTLTEQFLMQRERVTLGLTDGSMQITAVAVLASEYGVTILLPLKDDSVTFIPKPGSEIRISKEDKSWDCYFLGITFDLPALNMMGMVFVRNTEDA